MVLLQSPKAGTLICTQTDEPITLQSLIASGGEGDVWRTSRPGYLAKIYYDPTPERLQKLAVMIAHPPQDPNTQFGHISYAWPRSLLLNEQGDGVGFLMPEIPKSVELIDIYHPSRRQKVFPDFSWMYLHVIAFNVSSLVWAIHHGGYVLGDIKPQNILVNNEGMPGLIDTDSFQVRDPDSNELFRCLVGSESFTPPELLGQDLAWVEQTPLHDRFRLGIILYLLLFGEHPFKGQWVGPGESPSPNELVRCGFWPYAPQSLIRPSRLTISLEVLHPALRHCFIRCFTDGHRQPERRPSAQEWVKAFKQAIPELKPCRKVKRHIYSSTHGRCHWCDRAELLGIDVFPAPIPKTQRLLMNLQKQVQTSGEKIDRALQQTKGTPSSQTTPTNRSATRINYASTVKSPLTSFTTQTTVPQSPAASTPSLWYHRKSVQVGLAVLIGSGLFPLILRQSAIDSETFGLTIVGLSLCLGLVGLCFLLNRISK
jgi:DNA-binding helix-hairpin-helix protein with protein kinase domain